MNRGSVFLPATRPSWPSHKCCDCCALASQVACTRTNEDRSLHHRPYSLVRQMSHRIEDSGKKPHRVSHRRPFSGWIGPPMETFCVSSRLLSGWFPICRLLQKRRVQDAGVGGGPLLAWQSKDKGPRTRCSLTAFFFCGKRRGSRVFTTPSKRWKPRNDTFHSDSSFNCFQDLASCFLLVYKMSSLSHSYRSKQRVPIV